LHRHAFSAEKTVQHQQRAADHCERYFAAIRRLAPAIEAARNRVEHERLIPADLLDSLYAEGLLSLWLARTCGGPELSATDFVRIIEAVSALDGSVGWCTCIAAGYTRLSGFLSEEVARRIFSGPRPVLAGTIAPTGIARRVDGGWRVTGRWAFGSGIRHSTWVLGLCAEDTGAPSEDGTKSLRIALFPVEQATIIDTWDVIGLRGTGSHDYAVEDLFVPDEYTIPGLAEYPTQPGALYAMPLPSLFVMAIASVMLGIARGTLDAFAVLAGSKRVASTGGLLRDRAVVHDAVGRAEASLRAARAFLLEATDMIWTIAAAGETPPVQQRALVRLACSHVNVASKEAARTVFELAGGAGVYAAAGLERRVRDIQTAGQHVALHTVYFEHAGRVILGLDPGASRF
jgi:alkylation response protein AidB-like acyl-CoA dehydrogenase